MIDELSLEEWRHFDETHPAPTFFARPAWSIALSESFPNTRPAALRIGLAGRRHVIVPAVRVHGGALRWREYRAFPFGGYTCFLSDDGLPVKKHETAVALEALSRYADTATIIPWPLAEYAQRSPHVPHETAVVDLSNGLDAAMANVEGIFRRMAGQAERRGVVCAPSRAADAVDRYYQLLELSAKRWGLERPSITRSLIDSLVRLGGRDVEVWFARAEERDIAGGVVFYGSQELFFWSAAMDTEFGRLRPSNALNFALIRAAAARGMLWYNLGSSEGLPGVARFKRELGAVTVPYPEINLSKAPFRVYSSLRRAMATRASG